MHHDSQFFDAIVLIIQNWQGLNCCKCSHIKKGLFLHDFHDAQMCFFEFILANLEVFIGLKDS
jgi:hypothetical protein